jgi:hypothetical protein
VSTCEGVDADLVRLRGVEEVLGVPAFVQRGQPEAAFGEVVAEALHFVELLRGLATEVFGVPAQSLAVFYDDQGRA